MMKTRIFILLLLLGFDCYSQDVRILDYEKSPVEHVSQVLDKRMDRYVEKFNHDLERDDFLDFCAAQRSYYFLSVLEETSESKGVSLWKVFDQIPAEGPSKNPHNELFDNPEYFMEPSTPYIEAIRDFQKMNLGIQSEIMQFHYWTKKYTERKNIESLSNTIADELGNLSKSGILSQAILENYIASPSHHNAIIKDGNGQYGISTMVLMSERKLPSGEWKYEGIIINLVVFSKPLNR
jgi:hypothetical protein